MKKIRLDEIDKKIPFQVPEGYFDKLTVDIQARVSDQSKSRWVMKPELKWAMRGAFVVLLVLTTIFFPKTEIQTTEQLLAQVDDQELISYLESMELSDEQLALTLDETNLDELLDDSFDDLELNEEDLDDLLIDYEYELDNLL